jgi:hypothetical protein
LFLLLIIATVAARQGLNFTENNSLLEPDEIRVFRIVAWILLGLSTVFYLNFVFAKGIKGVRTSWKP